MENRIKEPMTHVTLRISQEKLKGLQNLALAMSLKGHIGQKRSRVTVSDLLRAALNTYSTDHQDIINLLNQKGEL